MARFSIGLRPIFNRNSAAAKGPMTLDKAHAKSSALHDEVRQMPLERMDEAKEMLAKLRTSQPIGEKIERT